MSMRTRLLKRQSSLAILVEQERETCESTSRPPSEIDQGTEDDPREIEENVEDVLEPGESNIADDEGLPEEKGATDDEGGDTDVPVSSEDENDPIAVSLAPALNKKAFSAYVREGKARAVEVDPPVRLSRRLMSMKRRGKALPMVDLTEEFEFYAGDFLTVRGEENDFYVCRVLEDVPESASSFNVAWFNRVDDNVYEVSFDDVCHMDSVVTRVTMSELEPEKFAVSKQHIKQTKKLLKEALAAERGEEDIPEEESVSEEEAADDEDEDEPPAKRTRRGSKAASTPSPAKKGRGQKKATTTPTKSPGQKRKPAEPKAKKERKKKAVADKKDKPRRAGVLIPNENIELLEEDPTFATREDIPLMPVKWVIRAVLLNDMEMLKEAIDDRENVYSVHWPRSPEIQLGAIHYALLNDNHEALKLLLPDVKNLHMPGPYVPRKNAPVVSLNRMDTGTYNFYTFGHAVRDLNSGRGSREGNNAFLEDEKYRFSRRGYDLSDILPFCFRKGVSLETVKVLLNEMSVLEKSTLHEEEQVGIERAWIAIRHGNRKVAGYFVSKGVDKFGFGFNFLHKEYSRRTLYIEGIPDYKMPSADEVLEDDVNFHLESDDVNDDDGDEFEAESHITQ